VTQFADRVVSIVDGRIDAEGRRGDAHGAEVADP
jgi:ABC-type hemin transport system ATPase subunit